MSFPTTLRSESSRRLLPIVGAFAIASAICFLLLAVRALFAGEFRWTGFVGNLFLAWIPLLLSAGICAHLDSTRPSKRVIGALFILWLLFFPNAAYIVTDLVHLKSRDPIPRWFDYILITAYAWTGLSLGYVSLTLLHVRVRRACGASAGWLFVIAMMAVGSLGVYVGRFLRWNSWDVFARPWIPLRDLVKMVEFESLRHIAAFGATFFALSVLVYVVMHAIAHLHAPAMASVAVTNPDRGVPGKQ